MVIILLVQVRRSGRGAERRARVGQRDRAHRVPPRAGPRAPPAPPTCPPFLSPSPLLFSSPPVLSFCSLLLSSPFVLLCFCLRLSSHSGSQLGFTRARLCARSSRVACWACARPTRARRWCTSGSSRSRLSPSRRRRAPAPAATRPRLRSRRHRPLHRRRPRTAQCSSSCTRSRLTCMHYSANSYDYEIRIVALFSTLDAFRSYVSLEFRVSAFGCSSCCTLRLMTDECSVEVICEPEASDCEARSVFASRLTREILLIESSFSAPLRIAIIQSPMRGDYYMCNYCGNYYMIVRSVP